LNADAAAGDGTRFDVRRGGPMFIERLLNQGNAPMLERWLQFTAARHRLIAEDVVNIDTPNYRQKDLSLGRFQKLLGERIEQRRQPGTAPGSVGFDDLKVEIEHPRRGMLYHDGNNRSTEQLMSDQAKNAMMHNLAIELLRKQFQTMEMALRERVS
jgi:flagellar basal-body rod protein FlgB